VVNILVTPLGSDFGNAVPRLASIRLVPPGIIVPPDGLQPRFTFTPTSPRDHEQVFFDASTSQAPANNPIVRYEWDFGDGDRGTGRTTGHFFEDTGTFIVRLTVFDAFGRSATTSQPITVGAGTAPTASFTFSPTEPLPGQQVNFNASGSRAATGRRIVSYTWDFGDGTPNGSGVQVSHTYTVIGTYVVTLTVTDDVGRTAVTTQEIPVGVSDDESGLVPRRGGS
jgi:PKD repeat protein